MTKPKDTNYWIYGRHAVEAALKNPNRRIMRLICTKENSHILKGLDINSKIMGNIDIARELGLKDVIHQGMAAYVAAIFVDNLNDVITQLKSQERSAVVILDQITDPQNIGAIIRSAAAFGAGAVILPKHNSPSESGAIAKASAGTIDQIPVVYIPNLANAIDQLKDAGYWIIGLDGEGIEPITKVSEFEKVAIVMGSEGSGMRRLTLDLCDLVARIDISNSVESLNVSNAAAVTLYEFNRK